MPSGTGTDPRLINFEKLYSSNLKLETNSKIRNVSWETPLTRLQVLPLMSLLFYSLSMEIDK